MRTFTINHKKYDQRVASIADAGHVAWNVECRLFPYQKNKLFAAQGVFIRLADGAVYHASRSVDLVSDLGCNDNVRRAWCHAAGVSWKDFSAALKMERERCKKEEASERVRDLRNRATRAGYKLVRA